MPRRVQERDDNFYNGPLVTIATDGGPIRTTLYHPFWVLRGHDLAERDTPRELDECEDQALSLAGRWVNSHELRAGDVLIGRDGAERTVLRIEQQYEEFFPVSNLTIEEDHTFAVGADAILVHNTSGCQGFLDVAEGMSDTARKYQRQVTGTPTGKAFFKNGVKFDGYKNGTLLEAKGPGYEKLLRDPELQATVGQKLLNQAERQLTAAEGTTLQWIVAEEEFAGKLEAMFQRLRIPIEVIFQPLK